jgi:anti-sigma B factor antagonist
MIAAPQPFGEDAVLIAVSGELTFTNAEELRTAMATGLAGERTRLVVDISDVEFMDSSAMSALLRTSVDAGKEGRSVAVVHAGPEPPGIFRFKGVERLLRLYASRDAAVRG